LDRTTAHRAWELPVYQSKFGETAPYSSSATDADPSAAPTGKHAEKEMGPHEFNVEPRNVHRFFSIYFCMTGLHGIHVLAGIGLWVWLLLRARTGEFGPEYFGPIDFAALYWHIVDLIWIYLFPLLYLIH
jgi:cytochrome c oxidase subunit 3